MLRSGQFDSEWRLLKTTLALTEGKAKVQVHPWGRALAMVDALQAEANPLAVLVNHQKPKQLMILDLLG